MLNLYFYSPVHVTRQNLHILQGLFGQKWNLPHQIFVSNELVWQMLCKWPLPYIYTIFFHLVKWLKISLIFLFLYIRESHLRWLTFVISINGRQISKFDSTQAICRLFYLPFIPSCVYAHIIFLSQFETLKKLSPSQISVLYSLCLTVSVSVFLSSSFSLFCQDFLHE